MPKPRDISTESPELNRNAVPTDNERLTKRDYGALSDAECAAIISDACAEMSDPPEGMPQEAVDAAVDRAIIRRAYKLGQEREWLRGFPTSEPTDLCEICGGQTPCYCHEMQGLG